jgi:hypothetical protein
MESYGEVGVADDMRLMKQFVHGQMRADQYKQRYFELTKKRVHIPDEESNRIKQQAYGMRMTMNLSQTSEERIHSGSESLSGKSG